ncbi:hypothetical protein J6590_066964 [Homalodisca vitripennis]|nr:hypothetical protein J6590_066964 [Homalodisca vitripennis]
MVAVEAFVMSTALGTGLTKDHRIRNLINTTLITRSTAEDTFSREDTQWYPKLMTKKRSRYPNTSGLRGPDTSDSSLCLAVVKCTKITRRTAWMSTRRGWRNKARDIVYREKVNFVTERLGPPARPPLSHTRTFVIRVRVRVLLSTLLYSLPCQSCVRQLLLLPTFIADYRGDSFSTTTTIHVHCTLSRRLVTCHYYYPRSMQTIEETRYMLPLPTFIAHYRGDSLPVTNIHTIEKPRYLLLLLPTFIVDQRGHSLPADATTNTHVRCRLLKRLVTCYYHPRSLHTIEESRYLLLLPLFIAHYRGNSLPVTTIHVHSGHRGDYSETALCLDCKEDRLARI